MAVDAVEALVVDAGTRPWLFVEVRTTEGAIGVGEGSQSRVDAGVVAHVERLAPSLLGEDPLGLVNRLQATLATDEFAGRAVHAATSAVEQALWDVAGKLLGLPTWRLLGGRVRDRVRAYANLALATTSPHPDAFADAASRAVAAGFTAVKIYPLGNFGGLDVAAGRGGTARSGLTAAADRVRAVRQTVGPDVDVLVDAAWSLRPADAVWLCHRLEGDDIHWLEEPFPGTDARQLHELRRRVPVRIAAGEQLLRPAALRHLLERHAVDVVMPDVKWVGGIAAARDVAQMAATWGVEASMHNMSGPVATAASAVVSATCRGADLLEVPFGADPVGDELVAGEHVRLVDGHVVVEERAGLGVGWDPVAARRLAARRR